MDQITHAVRSSNWKDIIRQCQNRPAGISAKQWMADNQVNEKAYYYWQRKLRKETYNQMNNSSLIPALQSNTEVSFAELRIPEPGKTSSDTIPEIIKPTAVIRTETMTIALSNDISDNLLLKLLREVSHA